MIFHIITIKAKAKINTIKELIISMKKFTNSAKVVGVTGGVGDIKY